MVTDVLTAPSPVSLATARTKLIDQWRDAHPTTPGEIALFYQGVQEYEAELAAWHALPERQAWTRAVGYVADKVGATRVLDVGAGAGHDLLALRDQGITDLVAVEPNHALAATLRANGLPVLDDVADADVAVYDLLLCIDVLEHLPDPESWLRSWASQARVDSVLIEATATTDVDTPLHLKSNQGWSPGRLLAELGYVQIDGRDRLRVWQRCQTQPIVRNHLILLSQRALTVPTCQSVFTLAGRDWVLEIQSNDALVSRARSIAASRWYRETNDDVLLWVDDDIVFDASDAEKLVQQCRGGKDLICAAYPVRSGEHLAVRGLPGGPPMEFGPKAQPFPIAYASTGFLAIHRRVFDALNPTVPLCHANVPGLNFWPLFDPFWVTNPDGITEYLSEDWALCQRARDAGFTVWLDPSIRIGHLATVPLDVTNMTAIYAATRPGR